MLTHQQQVIATGSTRNLRVLLIFFVFAALFTGCEGPLPREKPWRDQPDIQSWDEVEPSSQIAMPGKHSIQLLKQRDRKHTLRVHMDADPGTLNPLHNPTTWGLRITRDAIFETLIRYLPTEGGGLGHYESGLAKTWVVSPGGREIRLALQESAKFQDGKAVTAMDVQFSIESAMLKRGGADHHRFALEDISSVEIVGKHLLRIRMEKANGFILRELASIPILPEHYYLRRLQQSTGEWIGSGPYRIESQDDDGIILQRDPNYWGPAPAIDRIHYVRHQDSAVALREAKEGLIDIVPALIPEHYPEQLTAPGVYENFSTLELKPSTFSYVVLNTSKAPFEDVNVRRAVSHLIERSVLTEMSGGLSHSISGPIWPEGPGNGDSPAPLPFNPEEASRLLDVGGWRDDEGHGVRSRDGQRLMITVLATEGKNSVRDFVLSALRKAGFVLDIRVGNIPVLRNRLHSAEFDLAFVNWEGDVDRDLSLILGSHGKQNYGRFHDVDVDAYFSKIWRARQPVDRIKLVSSLATLLQQRMPIVALPSPSTYGLVHKRVQGLRVWNGWFMVRELSFVEEGRE